MNILQESAFTTAELEYYDKYWDNIRVEATLIIDAKVEGRKEQAIDTAKVLLMRGVDKMLIMQATGLTEMELERL